MSFSIRIVRDTATPMLERIAARLKESFSQQLQTVGGVMRNYAYDICPKRTGYLASTIFFKSVGLLDFEFGASAEYSVFVEMGTRFMVARPFIRPALEAYRDELIQAGWKAVKEAVK